MSTDHQRTQSSDSQPELLKGADVSAAKKLAELHANYQEKLKEALETARTQTINNTRDSIVEEFAEKLDDTIKRQLQHFVQVERELVLNLNAVLTTKYQDILSEHKDRNTYLLHAMRLVKERVVHDSEQIGRWEYKERTIDILLAFLCVVFPVYYRVIGDSIANPIWNYVIPTLLVCVIFILVFFKFSFHASRTTEAKKLANFVEDQFNSVRNLEIVARDIDTTLEPPTHRGPENRPSKARSGRSHSRPRPVS